MIRRIQKITRTFRASDGSEFGMQQEAVEHENFLAVKAWVVENLECIDSLAGASARKMIDDRQALRVLLARRHGNGSPVSLNQPIVEEAVGKSSAARRNRKKEKTS